ncbi:MAG: hypothetical protein R2838_07775 [Caldilineaceae bacterium]
MTQWARFSGSASTTCERRVPGRNRTSLADTFAQLDGLRWKIWTLNEETG